ncbi:hypothetical protein BAC3_02099 [uncultured bacterium]|nr:hypothetical protein BAC3_02099 [uncultured bacterium]
MTDFKDDKTMPRQPRLSPQNEHFDFDLADMRVLPDNDIQPSPLENITDDEDAIDRVLMDAGFSEQTKTEANRFASDETLLPPKAPEIKTSFYVDYFDKRKKTKTKTQDTPTSNSINTDTIQTASLVKEPVAIVTPVQETETPEPVIQNTVEKETVLESMAEDIHFGMNAEPENSPEPSFINGSGMAVAVLSQFKSKQESINKQQEKLIQEFSKKIKSATRITYLSMLFGLAALAIAVKLGFTLFQTENKLSELEKTNTVLKDDLRNIKALPIGEEGTDPSLDQITQKMDNFEEQLSDMAELQNKVALLEKNTLALARQSATLSSPRPETSEATAEAEPVVKTTPVKPIAKPNTSVVEKPTTKPATPAKAVHDEQSKPQIATKPAVSKPNTVIKKDDIIEKAIAVPANDINKVTAENHAQKNVKPAQIQPAVKPTQQSSGGWTVNLASSNRPEEAKKTAAIFQQKGIPVIVSPVTIKNETRYRLQVKGFKNKEEATAYANKAKAALNLNSVWINP